MLKTVLEITFLGHYTFSQIIENKAAYFYRPTISTFYGILIQMFWNDHSPAHFHAHYGEFKGIIDIKALKMLEGNLPRHALSLILDWAELHQEELLC